MLEKSRPVSRATQLKHTKTASPNLLFFQACHAVVLCLGTILENLYLLIVHSFVCLFGLARQSLSWYKGIKTNLRESGTHMSWNIIQPSEGMQF